MGTGEPLLRNSKRENSSGAGISWFVVRLSRNESFAPGVKEEINSLKKLVSDRDTLEVRSPLAPPTSELTGPALPPPKAKLLRETVLFPSPVPLPSVKSMAIEKGPSGLPIKADVSRISVVTKFPYAGGWAAIRRTAATTIALNPYLVIFIRYSFYLFPRPCAVTDASLTRDRYTFFSAPKRCFIVFVNGLRTPRERALSR